MIYNIRFFLIFLLIVAGAAGTAVAQAGLNIEAGVNFSKVIVENEAWEHQSTRFKTGVHVGLSADFHISRAFYIQPGLLYSRKGFKQKDNGFAGQGNDFTVAVSYFELPVNFITRPSLGSGRLLVGAGPYLGYGTGGKWESDEDVVFGDIIYDDHGEVVFRKDLLDGDYGSYVYGKRFDYGANFLLGYEFFNRIITRINIQLGLANLQPGVNGEERDGSVKNIGYGLTLGYEL